MADTRLPPENNSEKTIVNILFGAAMVLAALGGAVDMLAQGGLQEHWPWFAGVVSVFAMITPVVMSYIKSRPDKHQAIGARAIAEAKLMEMQAFRERLVSTEATLTKAATEQQKAALVPPSPPQS